MSDGDEEIQRALEAADGRFREYEARGAQPGTVRKIELLRAVREQGLTKVLSRRRTSGSRQEVLDLVELFKMIGPSSVLLTGSQRGGDFLNNQLVGQWAESVCCSMTLPRFVLLRFGPSSAAMPGDGDHARVVRAYHEITLVEGKRPDLVAVDRAWWEGCGATVRERVESWRERLLEDADAELFAHVHAGIEVKTSAWHYGRRREAGGGSLAITVKDEELEAFRSWSDTTGRPVLFLQVLFDEVYCMSFRRMLATIKIGHAYKAGDYVAELDRTSKKYYHRIFVNGPPHRCAKTVFPDQSEARVPVLPNGAVIPHVRLLPAQALDVLPEVIEAELSYRD